MSQSHCKTQRIQNLVNPAIGDREPECLFIAKSGTDEYHRLSAHPIPRQYQGQADTAQLFIILLSETQEITDIDAIAFQRQYKLTKSELNLSLALLNGQSLGSYTLLNSVLKNTVRWTLGNVFSKIEVNSQVALVSLMYKFLR